MQNINSEKATSVNMTSIQKYWYKVSLWTGDFPLYSCGCFMMCSSHHAALCKGGWIWSTANDPNSLALLVYFGSFITKWSASNNNCSDIFWNGTEMPKPIRSASFAFAGWSPATGTKTCDTHTIKIKGSFIMLHFNKS